MHSLTRPHPFSFSSLSPSFFKHPLFTIPKHPHFSPQPHRFIFTPTSLQTDNPFDSSPNPQTPPRTLFPGGYKRPEIKVPNIVLHVTAEDILDDGSSSSVLDVIDAAVAKQVGIVVVGGGEASGGKLYEAACLLKSVIRDRAYLLVAERVDIAAAVNASGVLLSDQGLPPIVARNTMMKSESVVLPVIGRIVETVAAAVTASISEGADFLILSSLEEEHGEILMESVDKNVRIPVFFQKPWTNDDGSFNEVSKLLMSGASGVVTTLADMTYSDVLGKLLYDTSNANSLRQVSGAGELSMLKVTNGFGGELGIGSSVKSEDGEAQFIRKEKRLLMAAANAIQKAAPLMEEISLLNDAISQLEEPFLLVIVGEFNSGKSTFINALLGGKFLKDGVVPTTNEITFLRYSEFDSDEQQRCEKHPDGQYTCFLPSKILKEMIIVDTPGTNVILQRQQRLTEEFVPRADLVLFVLSADRPLSESEVEFLRYTQQWKKKVMFLLNKADIYRTSSELEEAIMFVRENVQKLLNLEDVKLFPISARSALEAKLAASVAGVDQQDISVSGTYTSSQTFIEFEHFLYDFLDGSTTSGFERMKTKLQTPLAIAERLLSSCQTLVTQDCRYAKRDLMSVKDFMGTVKEYALRMESESVAWRRQITLMIEGARLRVIKLVESTLQLSNVDLAFSLISKGDKLSLIPATQSVQNDIVSPALSDAERLLGDYTDWVNKNYVREVARYKETFERRWPSIFDSLDTPESTSNYLLKEVDGQSLILVKNFSSTAASKLFDEEIRSVLLGVFGGLGAAGLSASLLTSVLPTTLEDLLALGLCSAGGLLAISNFPARRQKVVDKINSIANVLGREIEEAMQKDLVATVKNLEDFVAVTGKPFEDAAQQRLNQLLNTQEQLADIEKKLQTLQVELQNFHVS